MRITLKALAGGMAALSLAASAAFAFQVPEVTNATALKECSACHMIYPPQLLPARSWTALMGNLADHFGESATLDAKVQADITAFLTANAADQPPYNQVKALVSGIKDADVPLRITAMPWWNRVHSEVPQAVYARPNIKSKGNCVACHQGADKGMFGEAEGGEGGD